MTLEVEDGTGKANADAFVSVEDCDTYCTNRGLSAWTDAPDSPPEIKEAAIRRATSYLSNAFRWQGSRTNGRAQALAWPRDGVVDGEGEDIATDEVPREVVDACCEIAAYEIDNPGGLNPAVVLNEQVKREKVGSLEVEYAAGVLSAENSRPVLFVVRDLIGGFIASGFNSLVGTAVRR
jgi:hypothetical protein